MDYTKLAEEMYEGCANDGWFDGPYDYTPIIDYLGECLVRADEADYQGDTYVVLKKDKKYGLLVFGWGSCSGCDALQGSESYEDIGKLIEMFESSVLWFDTLDELKQHVTNRDGENSYFYHQDIWNYFVDKVRAL